MKNALIYYYNLNPINIHKKEKMYKFIYDNNYYTFLDITDNLKNLMDVYNLSIELNKNGIYTHQIILNNQNKVETYINDKVYVLLKSYGEMEEIIKIEDIINFSKITSNLDLNINIKRDNWYQLWSKKMDYFEYQISQISKKYPILSESFSYFEGIVETGISLLINENLEGKTLSVAHNRIKKKDTLFNFYNPFNLIIDSNVRDIVEYIKECIKDEESYYVVEEYLNNIKLRDVDDKLFFIRFL